jgi:hypothetical protein
MSKGTCAARRLGKRNLGTPWTLGPSHPRVRFLMSPVLLLYLVECLLCQKALYIRLERCSMSVQCQKANLSEAHLIVSCRCHAELNPTPSPEVMHQLKKTLFSNSRFRALQHAEEAIKGASRCAADSLVFSVAHSSHVSAVTVYAGVTWRGVGGAQPQARPAISPAASMALPLCLSQQLITSFPI